MRICEWRGCERGREEAREKDCVGVDTVEITC